MDLQGTWCVTALEVDGQGVPAAALEGARIVLEGGRFTSLGMGAEYTGTVTLDSAAQPPHIDMHFDAGPEAGNTNPGIFRLEGDQLTLCLATRGTVRPKKFAAPPGSGFALETLSRTSPPAAGKKAAKKTAKKTAPTSPDPSGPVTEFEGDWPMVSGVMNGKPTDPAHVAWVKRVTRGNQSSVIAGGQTMLKVEFTHDPKAGTIDYVNLAGGNKGKVQLGIYAFDGDLMKLCIAPPSEARPDSFESVKGDGRTFTVWKRP
jgi:uncharacterized protein (TIGR03067 family)